jgi:hypothetical protein
LQAGNSTAQVRLSRVANSRFVGVHLKLEDSVHQVRTVESGLAGQQLLLDLTPLGVARDGDEQVRLAQLPHNGHGILVQLMHMAGAAQEGGGKDDGTAHIAGVGVATLHCVLQPQGSRKAAGMKASFRCTAGHQGVACKERMQAGKQEGSNNTKAMHHQGSTCTPRYRAARNCGWLLATQRSRCCSTVAKPSQMNS